MIVPSRALAALLLLALVGCAPAPRQGPVASPEPRGPTRTALYGSDAIRVHDAVVETLQGLGEGIEEDRGDGQYVQSVSPERPDRTRIRTRVAISPQREGGTRVTVNRSVVRMVSGHEVEWTSLPMLPMAGDEVLERLDRRVERAPEPRR